MKKVNREDILRMVGRSSSGRTISSGGEGSGGGSGVSQFWVDENYVSKEFFNKLFEIHDENGDPILPNDVETEIDNIQAMFGFWTNAYLSALGNNPGGGGAELTLASLADVAVQGVADGQALVWNATRQKWVPGQGGIDVTAMWNALAGSTNQQINKTHLTTALADYLPLTGGTMTNTNLVTNLNAQYLNGYGAYNGTNSGYVFINDGNFCEMGHYIEFHYDTSGLDYSTLLQCTGNYQNIVSLPSTSGTIALTSDNVSSATKLQTARTIWGQSFDGTANVSGAITDATTISASSNVSVGGTLSVTGAATLSSTLGVSGLLTASGGITIPSGKTLTIGDAVLSWDSTNQGIKITKGLYSQTFISALGQGSGGESGGVTLEQVWTALGNSTTEQINISHLTTALSGYNPTSNFKTINGNSIIGTGNITIESGGGTVTAVKVGTTTYSPTDGVVSLPAYPTDADTLDGYHANYDNMPFGKIPVVTAGGFMDVGNSFEMHYDNSGSVDYSTRLYCTGDYHNSVALPSATGTLALTSQIPTNVSQLTNDSGFITSNASITGNAGSATKLQTARTIWGQSFDGTGNVSGSLIGVTSIEMNSDGALSGYGGFIDFHYSGSSADYTSRIIEDASGRVSINNVLYAKYGGNVGIGTTPSSNHKLYVSGTFYASGNSSIGGTFGVTGATTLSSTLSVSGTSTLTGHVGIGTTPHSTYVLRADGEVYVSTGLYSHGYVTALSDARHKDVKGDVGLTVSDVANAPAVKFLWKDRRQDGLQVGSIAQYWQKVMPEAIVEAADGELTMSYGVVALLASIANAREIVNLKREISELKRKLQKHGTL